jgi:hypothetical protein
MHITKNNTFTEDVAVSVKRVICIIFTIVIC